MRGAGWSLDRDAALDRRACGFSLLYPDVSTNPNPVSVPNIEHIIEKTELP